MEKPLLDYNDCIKRIGKIVPPKRTTLFPVDGKNDKMVEINEYILNHQPPVLYRYVPINKYAISSIINEDVYMLPASKMNDAFEGSAFGIHASTQINRKTNNKIQNNLYLKAFSFDGENNLMWSHYADEHRGICIEYDFQYAPKDVIEHLYPVQYSDKRFTFQNPTGINSHPFLLLRKSKDWAYEKEFRLIYKESDFPAKDHNIKLNCVTKIIFGLRTQQSDMDLVKCLLCGKNHLHQSDNGKKIRLYQIQQKPNSFKLKCVPLS